MKTRNVFVIQGKYDSQYGWEDLAEYDNRKEAMADLTEYNIAEPYAAHRVKIKNERADRNA